MAQVTFTPAELDELERLATAATQDLWQFGHSGTETLEDAVAWMTDVISHRDAPDLWAVFCGDPEDKPIMPAYTGNGPTSEANAAYLVAVQPRNVLALIAQLRRAMGWPVG